MTIKRYRNGNIISEDAKREVLARFDDDPILRQEIAEWIEETEDCFSTMLQALENLENDDEYMPATAWQLIQNAICKAKGE